MIEPNLMENNLNNINDQDPASSSRERIKEEEPQKEINKEDNNKTKENEKKEKDKKEKEKFDIELSYLKLEECTAMTLGNEKIYQKCFICPICNPKKNLYICKFCYNKCHQKCRDITGIQKKEEDYRGKKKFRVSLWT